MASATDPKSSPRTGNLAQRLVVELTERIRGGKLMPGMQLPTEGAMAEEFGVSRTVVRDATAQLKAAGLVESHRGRGTFVLMMPQTSADGPLSPATNRAEVADLLGFRMGVEAEAASLAASHATDMQRVRIGQAADSFRTAVPHSAESQNADYEFHRAVALASRNRHFPELLDGLGPAMIAFPAFRLGEADSKEGTRAHEVIAAEHAAVARAVTDGDPETARAAMRLHLANSRRRILHAGDGGQGPATT
ncbi:GntR family transcriptional regulator [Arthrobacter sp. NPDC089319]|uniref:FadR/GntR family transcriptional regulator n=1 Tax=Arthrobacter sp. NPDC089319 TaxID=3155915 RepID=UPI00343AC2EE